MGSFTTGILVAVALAIAAGVGLNSVQIDSAATFSTEETRL